MLLIGDIHITSRIQEKVLSALRSYIASHTQETTIVFLGDFVYHFSYDRQAILALYELFVELFVAGKTVYVLAGNHDWLGNSFVFAEAQQAFVLLGHQDLVKSTQGMGLGSLRFLSQPELVDIEGKKVFFLPYVLSEKKQEALSTWASELVLSTLAQHPELTVIHHYYLQDTVFPGQQSRFSAKDGALSRSLLDCPGLTMISGHLHQAFSLKNYLCTGSVWYTSPLEINHPKYVFSYNLADRSFVAQELWINPYFRLASGVCIDQATLEQHVSLLREKGKSCFVSSEFSGVFVDQKPALQEVSLSVEVDQMLYDQIDTFVDPGVQELVKEVKLKKKFEASQVLLEELATHTDNLSGFADWKGLLLHYLEAKYGQESEQYLQVLREMRLI